MLSQKKSSVQANPPQYTCSRSRLFSFDTPGCKLKSKTKPNCSLCCKQVCKMTVPPRECKSTSCLQLNDSCNPKINFLLYFLYHVIFCKTSNETKPLIYRTSTRNEGCYLTRAHSWELISIVINGIPNNTIYQELLSFEAWDLEQKNIVSDHLTLGGPAG